MLEWLPHALDYVERWLAYQMRASEQPGCVIAVARGADVVLDRAFGRADLTSEEAMSPRHRFRVASHSKTFTASALMLLRERGCLRLDDPLGNHVPGLPEPLAVASVGQAMAHATGLARDGHDCAHWDDLAPFPDRSALLREISGPLVLDPGTRMKYSNLGYGLLGLVIEAAAQEPFDIWVKREILERAGLTETTPDVELGAGGPFASGHSGKLPMGRRAAASRTVTNALQPAAGFVSTARDLVCFYSQLDPAANSSILAPASRREMTRRHWKSLHSSTDFYYGLGVVAGSAHGHDYFGHTGGFNGYQSRTCVVPSLGMTVSVLGNAVDAPVEDWVDGVVHILARFAELGPPSARNEDWRGRWWNAWGVVDLVPLGEIVLLAAPDSTNPFSDAPEISVSTLHQGWISSASGFGSYGEQVVRTVAPDGTPVSVRIAGEEHLSEEAFLRSISASQ